MTWRHLPGPARAVAVAASDAVTAATARDPDGFEAAVRTLATVDGSGHVLGVAVRLLLEGLHPDGLDGEAIRDALDGCVRDAAWLPDVDPHVVFVLLAGALGVYEPDEDPAGPDPTAQLRHAPLLLVHLLAATGQPFDRWLGAAFVEVQRTEAH